MHTLAPVRCDRCKSERHVIDGDGPSVCYPCVNLLTDAAADPMSVSEQLRESDAGVQAWEWRGWL